MGFSLCPGDFWIDRGQYGLFTFYKLSKITKLSLKVKN